MLRLAGGTHFIVLRSDGVDRRIFSYKRFDDAISGLEGRSRLSPIFPIDNAPPPAFSSDSKSHLIFIGSIYPGDILLQTGPNIYLSLGSLNLVLFCTTEEQVDEALAFAEKSNAAWEMWSISAGKILDVQFHTPTPPQKAPPEITKQFSRTHTVFLPTIRELEALLISTYASSYAAGTPQDESLSAFSSTLRSSMDDPSLTALEQLQLLTLSNVSLSRHVWQTYSGTSPIIEHPCHFSTHSLLGVGTASRGLENIVRFSEQVYTASRLVDRIQHLRHVAPHSKPLYSISSMDSYWQRDFLHDVTPPLEDVVELPAKHLPQISYFSGRDGFRSTNVSITAPSETIAACSSSSWTLQTVTHELSHTQVRAILGLLLYPPHQVIDTTHILSVMEKPSLAKTLFEQVQVFLVHALWNLNSKATSEFLTPKDLDATILQNAEEANETITHIFDFMYHYNSDEERYVRSLWTTWATIPHIEDRIPSYVARTLCAIHTNNLRRQNSYVVTIDSLIAMLTSIKEEFKNSPYVEAALEHLAGSREWLLIALKSRSLLIRFARHILFSPRISAEILRAGSGIEEFKPEVFAEPKMRNPLLFLNNCPLDKAPNAIRSVWIWHYLAYGVQLK